jgi:hypothetical protein
MKKILKHIIIGCLAIGLQSCNKWLLEDSGDLMIPQSVLEFVPLLQGEAYPHTFNADVNWFVLMTDDVEVGIFERNMANPQAGWHDGFDVLSGGEGRYAFRWDMDIEERISDNFWTRRYRNILGANTIIANLPAMDYTEAQVGRFHHLAAQAYALRALNYFWLVNTYALPWSPENLDKPGVILRETPDISTDPRQRATIGTIWEFINVDLKRAEQHMKQAEVSPNRHLIGPAALMLLQTRAALFQENWDEVIRVGAEFLRDFPAIHNLNIENENDLGAGGSASYIFNMARNNEIIFTFGDNERDYRFLSNALTGAAFGFRVSIHDNPDNAHANRPLISLYESGDLRRLAYFEQTALSAGHLTRFNFPTKMGRGVTNNVNNRENWRTVEVLLNVAEAYARQATTISPDAITLLNRLRANRIRTADYRDLRISNFRSRQELIEFIWDERRRELCFEEAMRWWDLRRQGMPQLVRREVVSANPTGYEIRVLPQGSPNYVLPIPRQEAMFNTGIVNNLRVQITPQ